MTDKGDIQSGISPAAADVEDISDFIGSGGISSITWTGIPSNKVPFLCIFPDFCDFSCCCKKKEKE